MFADSLNSLHTNSSEITTCLLGSSSLEVSLRPCLTGGMNIEELYYPISNIPRLVGLDVQLLNKQE